MKNPIREALMNPYNWKIDERPSHLKYMTKTIGITVDIPTCDEVGYGPEDIARETKAFIADLKAADFAQCELREIREMLRPIAKALGMSDNSYSVSSSVVATLLTRMAQITLQTGDKK